MVKEADALTAEGYKVTVLYAYWNDWGTVYDVELLAQRKWKAIRVGGSPTEGKTLYYISRAISAVIKRIGTAVKLNFINNLAISRVTYLLYREAKKQDADLYLAHNLAALPAAVKAAKANKKLCGFDAEDFHRNEVTNDAHDQDVILKSHIEDKYIPQIDYFTASSPQIAEVYEQIFQKKPEVLLNVFPKSNLKDIRQNENQPIKLFWFSQTIGPNRGIDDVIKALQVLNKDQFELHLLGNRPLFNKPYINSIRSSGINVKFHDPVPPEKLVNIAAEFDVGLALEPAFSKNNDLALSNKLFTYMQAGLAIVASNTTAQQDFMNKNRKLGKLYSIADHEQLARILQNYHDNREELSTSKTESLRLANEKYNWESESQKLLLLVNKTLKASE